MKRNEMYNLPQQAVEIISDMYALLTVKQAQKLHDDWGGDSLEDVLTESGRGEL